MRGWRRARPLNSAVRPRDFVDPMATRGAARWRVLNVLARVAGLTWVFGGGVGFLSLIQVSTLGSSTRAEIAIGLVVSAFGVGVGVAFLRVKPYRPDLEYAHTSIDQNARGYNWWTGEPKGS
jgi:hypothetical protein